jgi:peptidoglycan/LPS O-acetylase OafA/YrhL
MAAGVLLVLSLLASQLPSFQWGNRVLFTFGLTLLAATALALLLISVLDGQGRLASLLQWRVFTVPGKYSYFLYLFHLLVFFKTAIFVSALWQRELLAVTSLGVLAALSWRFLELPILLLGHLTRYDKPVQQR